MSAIATSQLAVSFSSNTPSICNTGGINGTTISALAAGTCMINANQSGNNTYNAAPQVTQSITINQLPQTIGTLSFTPATLTLGVGGVTTVSASASSGLPVSFASSTPGMCTVNGTIITGIGAGTCTITANQAGNADYAAAPQVTQALNISQTDQTIGAITFTPATLVLGGSSTVSATSSSGLTVGFGTATPSVCSVTGQTVQGLAVGTCVVTANQVGNATYRAAQQVTKNLGIGMGTQTIGTITFTPTTLSPNDTTKAIATASSGLPVSFTATTPTVCVTGGINGTTITGIAAGTCTITANQAGNANYTAAMAVTQNITVGTLQQAQVITFTAVPSLVVGGNGIIAASGGASGNPVTFRSSTPAICSVVGNNVTGIAVGTCTIDANQAGNVNYNAAPQVTQSIAVGPSLVYQLAVANTGTGKGTVTSNIAGINCGSDCNENYAENTVVTLKATPASGAIFGGWGGSCKGVKNCTLSMTAAKNVAATFTAMVPDFVITAIKLTPSTPTANIKFIVRVTVKNEGTLTGKGASLRVWADQPLNQKCSAAGGAVVWDIGNLAAGRSKSVNVDFSDGIRPKATGEKRTIRAFIDSECEVNESNENNNQRTQTYNVRW